MCSNFAAMYATAVKSNAQWDLTNFHLEQTNCHTIWLAVQSLAECVCVCVCVCGEVLKLTNFDQPKCIQKVVPGCWTTIGFS